MKGPASARAVAKAKGKTTTKGIGKDKGKEGKGKGKKGNGKGKARQWQGQGQEGTCANNPLATCHPPSALTCANCHMQWRWPWKIDEDDAARAAIRAEADAVPESTVEAIMVEARTRDATGFNGLPDTRRMSLSELSRLVVDEEENAPLVGKGKSKDGVFGDKGKSKGSRSRSRSGSVGLEEALVAGQNCKKCVATLKFTKGCQECRGDWFSHIRMKTSTRKNKNTPLSAISPELSDASSLLDLLQATFIVPEH